MLKKIRSLASNSDFIEVYDNVLTQRECDRLIYLFEKSKKVPGLFTEDGVQTLDFNVKKGCEIEDAKFSKGDSISNCIKPFLLSCIDKYSTKYSGLGYLSSWKYDDAYTFKKFESEDDGFKEWHTEHGPFSISNRILAWMFYLNDAKSGTEFMHYSTVCAKMGRCIIWPASWSHIHRSAPNKGLKYIISGWISYQ